MKKIVTFLMASTFAAFAQAQCTPDATATGLVSPAFEDLNLNLEASVPYEQTITINVPSDTSFAGSPPIGIDSITIDEVIGLPSGINYQCQNFNCSTPGGQRGCVSVFGTPDQAGTYSVTLSFTVHTLLLDIPTSETIQIVVSPFTNVENLSSAQVGLTVFPNPTKETASLRFNMISESEATISVINMLGSTIFQSKEMSTVGINAIELPSRDWNAGYYLINLEMNGQQFTQKFSIIR